jgi:hypothetical protein
MANSILGLYNLALQHIGMKKVSATTGTDPSTVALNNYYEVCRDDVFREFKWPFATVQQSLNESSVVSAPLDWLFAYNLPTLNVASVWCVFNEATYTDKDDQDFQILYDPTNATKVICSDLEDAYYEYTYIVTDPTIWDAKFYLALSYKLAASIAHVLLGDAEKGMKLMEVYNAIIAEAKRISSYEKRRKPNQDSSYQNSRG